MKSLRRKKKISVSLRPNPLQTSRKLPKPPKPRNLREPLPAEEVSPSFGKSGRLPEDPKNLELIVRDVDAKGYLDIELAYRLRRKESLGSAKQKIARKIQQNESVFCFEDLVMEAFEAGCV